MKRFLLPLFMIISNYISCQTLDSVWQEINCFEIKFPEIVLRQAVWETRWFDCTKCSLRYNNIFGFRSSKKAEAGNPMGYFKFDNWQTCIEYYKTWQDRNYKGETNYYQFLKDIGFAEDPDYEKNLKSLNIKIDE